jgi:hypothetical protein
MLVERSSELNLNFGILQLNIEELLNLSVDNQDLELVAVCRYLITFIIKVGVEVILAAYVTSLVA